MAVERREITLLGENAGRVVCQREGVKARGEKGRLTPGEKEKKDVKNSDAGPGESD